MTTRQDSAFYCDQHSTQLVQKVNDRYEVDRVGDMLVGVDGEYIRSTGDLERIGITNDKELMALDKDPSRSVEWHMNSWFEIYDNEMSEYLDEPFHSLNDALDFVEVLISEETR